MSRTKWDGVYYWVGGTERGEWRFTQQGAGETIEEVIAKLEHTGRVALRGKVSIGPPDTPPSAEAIAEVLKYKPRETSPFVRW